MKRKVQVAKDFLRYNPLLKVSSGKTVAINLQTNASKFPNLPIGDVALTLLCTTLESKISDAASGDHNAIVERNAAEKEWDAGYNKTANYVNTVADSDEVIIALSGFNATSSETIPSHIPTQITGVIATTSQQAGSIHAECDKDENVWTYVWLVMKHNTAPSINIVNNKLSFTVNDNLIAFQVDTHNKIDFQALPNRVDVDIVVYGVNVAGSGIVSVPVQVFVM